MNADSFWLQHDEPPSTDVDTTPYLPVYDAAETQEVELPTKPYPVAPYDPDALDHEEEWTPLQRAIWQIWERARRRLGL